MFQLIQECAKTQLPVLSTNSKSCYYLPYLGSKLQPCAYITQDFIHYLQVQQGFKYCFYSEREVTLLLSECL